jgi:hypothetical protein
MVVVDQLFYKGLYGSLEDLDVLSFLEWIPKLVFNEESKREMKIFLGMIFYLKSGALNEWYLFTDCPWHEGDEFVWPVGSPVPASPQSTSAIS